MGWGVGRVSEDHKIIYGPRSRSDHRYSGFQRPLVHKESYLG